MRLKASEQQIIIDFFRPFLNEPATLFLFGSRVDDAKKGGDIDLLIIGEEPMVQRLKKNKAHLSAGLQEKLGEQKIDVTIVTSTQAKLDPFIISVLPTAISLLQVGRAQGPGDSTLK